MARAAGKDAYSTRGWELEVFERLKSLPWWECRIHNGRGPVLESKINPRLEHTPGEGVKTKRFPESGEGLRYSDVNVGIGEWLPMVYNKDEPR